MAQTWIIRNTSMKARITYKEFTILLGVLVAAIILLIIWLHPASVEATEVGKTTSSWFIPSVKLSLKKAEIALQLFR